MSMIKIFYTRIKVALTLTLFSTPIFAQTTPDDIGGCAIWLNSQSLMSTHDDGDCVSIWRDHTANGNDATAEFAPIFRDGTGTYHGIPSLEFSGLQQRLTIPAHDSFNNSNVTYVIVCQLSDLRESSDPCWLLNKANTKTIVGLRVADKEAPGQASGKYQAFVRTSNGVNTVTGRGPSRQAWTVLIVRYDGENAELYVNDHMVGSVSAPGALDSNGSLCIGNHSTVDAAWRGSIAEVVVYDNAISNGDRESLTKTLMQKYSNSEYSPQGSILAPNNRSCRIRTAAETGGKRHQMLVVTTKGEINHYDSSIDSPHDWVLRNSNIIPTNRCYRTLDFWVNDGKWFVYIDRAKGAGAIELWTGDSVLGLNQHRKSPIIKGAAKNYVRTPAVLKEESGWTMVLSVRTDWVLGDHGHLDLWRSKDGLTWRKDTAASPVLTPVGNGFEHSDITHPALTKLGPDNYLLAYIGYNGKHPMTAVFPHEIGFAVSTDLRTFTRRSKHPAITHSPGEASFDQALVANPAFFNDGSHLNCYYAGRTLNAVSQLGYAQGPVTWVRPLNKLVRN